MDLSTSQLKNLMKPNTLLGYRWEPIYHEVDHIYKQAAKVGAEVTVKRQIVGFSAVDIQGSIKRNTRFQRKFDRARVEELALSIMDSECITTPIGFWMPVRHPHNQSRSPMVDVLGGNHRMGVCKELDLAQADMLIIETDSQKLVELLRDTLNNLQGEGNKTGDKVEMAMQWMRSHSLDVSSGSVLKEISKIFQVKLNTLQKHSRVEQVRQAARSVGRPNLPNLNTGQLEAIYGLHSNHTVMGEAARVFDRWKVEKVGIKALVQRIKKRKASEAAMLGCLSTIDEELKESKRIADEAKKGGSTPVKGTRGVSSKPERDAVMRLARAFANYLERRKPLKLSDMAITTPEDEANWFKAADEIRSWLLTLDNRRGKKRKHARKKSSR